MSFIEMAERPGSFSEEGNLFRQKITSNPFLKSQVHSHVSPESVSANIFVSSEIQYCTLKRKE